MALYRLWSWMVQETGLQPKESSHYFISKRRCDSGPFYEIKTESMGGFLLCSSFINCDQSVCGQTCAWWNVTRRSIFTNVIYAWTVINYFGVVALTSSQRSSFLASRPLRRFIHRRSSAREGFNLSRSRLSRLWDSSPKHLRVNTSISNQNESIIGLW